MFGCLFIGIGNFDENRFSKQPPHDLQPGWKIVIGEAHRYRNRRKAGMRRNELAVVTSRTLVVSDLPWGIAPGWINDGIQSMLIHSLQYSLTEINIPRLLIEILTPDILRERDL